MVLALTKTLFAVPTLNAEHRDILEAIFAKMEMYTNHTELMFAITQEHQLHLVQTHQKTDCRQIVLQVKPVLEAHAKTKTLLAPPILSVEHQDILEAISAKMQMFTNHTELMSAIMQAHQLHIALIHQKTD